MENEPEVETALLRHGFSVVYPQNYSVDEQVAMFSRARVVVGPHGAGLTNTVFAPQGSAGRYISRWLEHSVDFAFDATIQASLSACRVCV